MSSSDFAISVRGLAKAYTIRHNATDHITLAELALDRLKHPLRRAEREQFWALHEMSFEVRQGEVLGLVGRNGAGKSTLLKVLSRITDPTRGEVHVRGRVGSLLEVGTGFHPELTGRENVYLNGSILGMQRREIDRQFDAIVAFAGVERFLDTPVKRYSSGMYVRLAFAVAAHLETEILLVDEVLAVGDAEFQKKCVGKMGELAEQGRTVLFVSHNVGLVSQMSERSIVLENGRVAYLGPTPDALSFYRSGTAGSTDEVYFASDADRWDLRLERELEIQSVSLAGSSAGVVPADADLEVELALVANTDVAGARVYVSVVAVDGVHACAGFTPPCLWFRKGDRRLVTVRLQTPRLAPGQYALDVATGYGDHFSGIHNFDGVANVHPFEVAPPVREDGSIGSSWNPLWGLTRLDPLQVLDIPKEERGDGKPSAVNHSRPS
jgi:lipopolysaccharide transport system ATP-binding protein